MILGLLFQSSSGAYEPMTIPSISNSQDLWLAFQSELPHYAAEVFTALFPILAFFLLFQIFFLKMRKRQVVKILVGMLYSYIGLTLFLTGVNVGFMPAGSYLGKQMASLPYRWILVPVAMLIGSSRDCRSWPSCCRVTPLPWVSPLWCPRSLPPLPLTQEALPPVP